MPKKPTTTKEAMIDGAFRLIREHGYEALTVRNLASFLGCSTQPIMYQFPDTDILKRSGLPESRCISQRIYTCSRRSFRNGAPIYPVC